jgi:hypothetical protein
MITSLSNLIENTYIRYTRNQQDMYLLLEFIVAATTVFRKSETIYICSVGNHFFQTLAKMVSGLKLLLAKMKKSSPCLASF